MNSSGDRSAPPPPDATERARVPPIPLASWVAWATRLEVRSIEVEARFDRPIRARDPLNVVARGLLGERLRDLRCLTRAPSCAGCTEAADCDYGLVFDDALGVAEGGSDGSGAPRPFWLQGVPASTEVAAGSALRARLLAVGPAIRALPYLDVALRGAMERLGAAPGLAVMGVHLSASRIAVAAVPALRPGTTLRIATATPVALRGNWDAARAACPAAPWLALLLRGAVRRLDQLATTFGGSDERPFASFPPLDDIEVLSGGLSRWTGARISHKQQRRIPLEGLAGDVVVRGRGLAEATPLLAAAGLFGIGKLTSMGFGVLDVSTPDEETAPRR